MESLLETVDIAYGFVLTVLSTIVLLLSFTTLLKAETVTLVLYALDST
jgi:hypothetical protein